MTPTNNWSGSIVVYIALRFALACLPAGIQIWLLRGVLCF